MISIGNEKKSAYCWNNKFPLMGLALRPDGDFK